MIKDLTIDEIDNLINKKKEMKKNRNNSISKNENFSQNNESSLTMFKNNNFDSIKNDKDLILKDSSLFNNNYNNSINNAIKNLQDINKKLELEWKEEKLKYEEEEKEKLKLLKFNENLVNEKENINNELNDIKNQLKEKDLLIKKYIDELEEIKINNNDEKYKTSIKLLNNKNEKLNDVLKDVKINYEKKIKLLNDKINDKDDIEKTYENMLSDFKKQNKSKVNFNNKLMDEFKLKNKKNEEEIIFLKNKLFSHDDLMNNVKLLLETIINSIKNDNKYIMIYKKINTFKINLEKKFSIIKKKKYDISLVYPKFKKSLNNKKSISRNKSKKSLNSSYCSNLSKKFNNSKLSNISINSNNSNKSINKNLLEKKISKFEKELNNLKKNYKNLLKNDNKLDKIHINFLAKEIHKKGEMLLNLRRKLREKITKKIK